MFLIKPLHFKPILLACSFLLVTVATGCGKKDSENSGTLTVEMNLTAPPSRGGVGLLGCTGGADARIQLRAHRDDGFEKTIGFPPIPAEFCNQTGIFPAIINIPPGKYDIHIEGWLYSGTADFVVQGQLLNMDMPKESKTISLNAYELDTVTASTASNCDTTSVPDLPPLCVSHLGLTTGTTYTRVVIFDLFAHMPIHKLGSLDNFTKTSIGQLGPVLAGRRYSVRSNVSGTCVERIIEIGATGGTTQIQTNTGSTFCPP